MHRPLFIDRLRQPDRNLQESPAEFERAGKY